MDFFGSAKPFIVAGPCSAETREQTWETAEAISQLPVQLFRAGVWKPRTRPGSFEGTGTEALQWLSEIQQHLGLRTTVEVAEPAHVEQALKYGIHVFWIGARTTVNPFQVQKICDALKGVNIPVMVKNPVSPDVDLWQGSIERLMKTGITDIAAIHRGFYSYGSGNGYRNQPNWTIPIELKRRMPELSILCDPSHITGKRSNVAETAQKAMDMHFDGLMIETHPRPEEAWSDAAQQITPAELKTILETLVVRDEFITDMTGQVQLEHLREQMDITDAEIIDLLARRMDLSEQIGIIKNQYNMTFYQPARWREILESRCNQGILRNLPGDFVAELFEKIHSESIRRQFTGLKQPENK